MADTIDIPVNSVPKDIVSDYSLAQGTYYCENTGSATIRILQRDSAVNVGTLSNRKGHRLYAPTVGNPQGGDKTITTDGSSPTYVYTEQDDLSSTLTITSVEA